MFRPSNRPDDHGANERSRDDRKLSHVSSARLLRGLSRLQRAYEYGLDLEGGAWEFAIEIGELLAADMTRSDLRWLVRKGLVQHAREVTLPGEETRDFHPSRGLIFTRRTCFVLTEAGVEFVAEMQEQSPRKKRADKPHARVKAPLATPHWDAELQELRLGSALIKQFKVPAPNQEMVLAAFEEEGWPVRIDDPLPPQPQQDSKRRLHDTINSLNRNHRVARLRFIGDGTGTGVRWTMSDVNEPAAEE
ncbi:MAG: hypothetical protein JSS27_16295 [Planctomycetes bacterium]|nr:hypothetical protein [Planctomycetota bacterium]